MTVIVKVIISSKCCDFVNFFTGGACLSNTLCATWYERVASISFSLDMCGGYEVVHTLCFASYVSNVTLLSQSQWLCSLRNTRSCTSWTLESQVRIRVLPFHFFSLPVAVEALKLAGSLNRGVLLNVQKIKLNEAQASAQLTNKKLLDKLLASSFLLLLQASRKCIVIITQYSIPFGCMLFTRTDSHCFKCANIISAFRKHRSLLNLGHIRNCF